MANLIYQRCFNHALREAVARCPECRQFYCRECITEHDDRVICAACLSKLPKTGLLHRPGFMGVMQFFQCLLAVLVAWFFFYLLGESLLSLPTAFHERTLWRAKWLE